MDVFTAIIVIWAVITGVRRMMMTQQERDREDEELRKSTGGWLG